MSTSADQQGRLTDPLPNLHDATLNTVNFDWSRGVVSFAFKVDIGVSSIIEATGVTELKCPRLLPWGPSDSVNSTAVEAFGDGQRLIIKMQSGDVLEVCCRVVGYKPAPE
jgi:hypothetical protein